MKTVLFKDKGLSGLPYVGSDFFADLVVVALAAVAGDHLADEAGEEELETQQHGYESQVEQRLVSDGTICQTMGLLDKFLDDDPDGCEATGKEHENACEAEEVHGLLAETAEEP